MAFDRRAFLLNHAAMVGRPRKEPSKARKLFIGEWISALGHRPVDVVKATGIDPGYLSKLIKGEKRNPSLKTLADIADFLAITIDSFYRLPPPKDFIAQVENLDPRLLARLMAAKKPS